MADSRSQSVFISLRGAAANRKAHFQSARRTCKFAPEKFWSERAPLVFRFRTGTVCMMNKTMIELDGRPSDCIAMATQQKAPIYVSQDVWDEVDDMSDILRKMEEEGLKPDPETEE